jgi:hypothetical protein
VRVKDVAELAKMKAYLSSRDDARIIKNSVQVGNDSYDCIDRQLQLGVARAQVGVVEEPGAA